MNIHFIKQIIIISIKKEKRFNLIYCSITIITTLSPDNCFILKIYGTKINFISMR